MRWHRRARVIVLVALCLATPLHAQRPSPAAALGPVDADLGRCFQNAQVMPAIALAIADQLIATPAVPAVVELRAHACATTASASSGDPARAVRHADAIIALLDTQPFSADERFRALHVASGTLGVIGEWQRSLELLQQAGDEARSFHNVFVQIETLAGIAAIQNTWMDDPQLADATLREAIGLAVAAQAETPMLYYNFGYNLLALGQHDAAMAAFDRALVMLASPGPQPGPAELLRARVQTHRGVILQARGEHDAARALYDASLATQTRMSEQQGRAVTLMHLGALKLEQQQATQALANVQQALQLAEQGHFAREQLAAAALLARIHTALGQHDDARAMVARGNAIETGILRGQNPAKLAGLQTQLAGDVETAGLERAARVRTLALGALVIVLVFALGIGIFHWRLRRRAARG